MLEIQPFVIQAEGHRLTAELIQPDRRFTLYFASPDLELAPRNEALLTAAALPAMRQQLQVIRLSGAVSPRFLENLNGVMAFFRQHKRNYLPFRVEGAQLQPAPPSTEQRVGLFFSGGVDSFYTLLQNQETITDLIFLHGYDQALDEQGLRQGLAASARQVAAHYGKRAIELESNIRLYLDPQVPWIWSFGAGLAAPMHTLAPHFSRFYFSGAHAYTAGELVPAGVDPRLDPYWGTEALEVIHFGADTPRVEKTARVAQDEFALQHLFVCLHSRPGAKNCGRCEKCLRTMIDLAAVGALERCTTFAEPLDLKRVAGMRIANHHHRALYSLTLAYLERSGANPALEKALRTALNRADWLNQIYKQARKVRARLFPRRRYQPPA